MKALTEEAWVASESTASAKASWLLGLPAHIRSPARVRHMFRHQLQAAMADQVASAVTDPVCCRSSTASRLYLRNRARDPQRMSS